VHILPLLPPVRLNMATTTITHAANMMPRTTLKSMTMGTYSGRLRLVGKKGWGTIVIEGQMT
jgi:hypothetical protein